MQVEVAEFLVAILDLEGGSYRIPLDAYKAAVENTEERIILVDSDDNGESITLSLTTMEEAAKNDV